MPTPAVSNAPPPRELRVAWDRPIGLILFMALLAFAGLVGAAGFLLLIEECLGLVMFVGFLVGGVGFTYAVLTNTFNHTRYRFDGRLLHVCHRPFPLRSRTFDLADWEHVVVQQSFISARNPKTREVRHEARFGAYLQSPDVDDAWLEHQSEDPGPAEYIAANVEVWREEAVFARLAQPDEAAEDPLGS